MRLFLFIVILLGGAWGLNTLFGWDIVYNTTSFWSTDAFFADVRGFMIRINEGWYGIYQHPTYDAARKVDSPVLAWAGLWFYFSMLGSVPSFDD